MENQSDKQVSTLGQGPSVVRSEVALGKPYSYYRECLRLDFWYSCSYCSVAEVEATGFSFEIDHYEPQRLGNDDLHSYDNLMWSCRPCNRSKDGNWESDELRQEGYRFLRPDKDDLSDHYKLVATVIVPRTTPAEYTVEVLNLNRESMRAIRSMRARFHASKDSILQGLQALRNFPLDQLPVEVRRKFAATRGKLLGEAGKVESNTEEAIRDFNHSLLIDPASDEAESRVRRRNYLRSIRSVGA